MRNKLYLFNNDFLKWKEVIVFLLLIIVEIVGIFWYVNYVIVIYEFGVIFL